MMNFPVLVLVLLAPISENHLYTNPDRIEISHKDRTLLTIRPDMDYWKGRSVDSSEVRMSLAYRHLFDKWHMAVKPAPWKWVAEVGTPSLLVFETTGDDLAEWNLRQFLWKKDQNELKEIPPIHGTGKVFYFRDFNGDGALEFATAENFENVRRNGDGIPISPHVYFFDGTRYRPTAGP